MSEPRTPRCTFSTPIRGRIVRSRVVHARCSGFTLLEMVVVLAIMGLVIGVAAVRIFTMIESWRVRTQLEGIEQQFAHLPMLARQRGVDIVLPPPAWSSARATDGGQRGMASAAASLSNIEGFELPVDWKVTFDKPLRVRSNGLCEGAVISIQHDGRMYDRKVTVPFCEVTALSDERP